MKQLLCLLLLTGMVSTVFGQRYNPETYESNRNIIKLSPWQLLGGIFEVSYERSLNEGKSSLQLMPAVTLRDRGWQGDSFSRIWGIEGMSQYRFYYNGHHKPKKPAYQSAVARIYAAPYYRIKYMQANYTQNLARDGFEFSDGSNNFEDQSLSQEGGFVAGLQLLAWDRFSFDLYAGGGVRFSQLVSNNPFDKQIRSDNMFNPAYSGVVPRLNFTMGIAF